MELRHLRYFVAIAEEGHVTRAAQRLGMQQPPLSQQLQALEREVGTALFDRLPRGVSLTPAGKVFLVEARAVLERSEQSIARARQAAAGQVGRVALGLTISALLHPMIPRALARHRREHPAVHLDLDEGSAVDLVQAVARGALDLALVHAVGPPPFGVAFEEVLREPLVVVLPPDHPLAARRIDLGQLRGERLILARRPDMLGMHARLVDDCRRVGIDPEFVTEGGGVLSAVRLVAAGMGIAVLPASAPASLPLGISTAEIAVPSMVAALTVVHRVDEDGSAAEGMLGAIRRAASWTAGDP